MSFSPVETPLVTRQLVVLTAIVLGFSTCEFFFPLPFTPVFFLAAVIGLLPGLLGVEKGFRKSHRGGQFLLWSS